MWLALTFFGSGLFITTITLLYGWSGFYLLLWPGISLMVIGVAYALMWGGVFGKRADGRMPLWSLIIHFPYLVAIWVIWWTRRLSKEPICQLVAPGMWLGRRPRKGEVPAGVGLVVDLTAEFPKPPGATDCSYRCLPTLDGRAPREHLFAHLVKDVASADQDVYLCCAAGHGRSAALAAAVLILRNQAADVNEAERLLRATRPRVALTRVQRRIVERATAQTQVP